MSVAEMARTHPADLGGVDRDALVRCVEECLACAQACTVCADACLSEPDDRLPELRACIGVNADCADLCETTARLLSRRTAFDEGVAKAVLVACATLCRSCGDECARHAAHHEHCRVCAQACRRCEQACRELVRGLG